MQLKYKSKKIWKYSLKVKFTAQQLYINCSTTKYVENFYNKHKLNA